MPENFSRLYLVSGKGGVGKSVIAESLVLHLNTFFSQKESFHPKVKIVTLGTQKIVLPNTSDHFPSTQKTSYQNLENHIVLDIYKTVHEFVARKINSETGATWVLKTPFFRALINMIPGLSYLIYLGKILQLLKDDPKLVLVFDAPATGHLMTMLESTHNFSKIFKQGLLFQDTQKILALLNTPHFVSMLIVSNPSPMPFHEAVELDEEIKKIQKFKTFYLCNNCLEIENDSLPLEKRDFQSQLLSTMLAQEQKTLNDFKAHAPIKLPMIASPDTNTVIRELSQWMNKTHFAKNLLTDNQKPESVFR